MAFQRTQTDMFQDRKLTIQVIFILVALILMMRACELQVISDEYAKQAEITAVNKYTIYPSRGLILDRKGKLLINNNPVYDLNVTYNQINPAMDTAKFCQLLGIDKAYFKEALNKDFRRDYRYNKYKPFAFLTKISSETHARFQESMYEFPGFEVQLRNVRAYPYRNAAHVLGYMREVNQKEVNAEGSKYVPGDYIGVSGLEKEYEQALRGEKGQRFILKNNRGQNIGEYKEGDQDIRPKSGKDLISTLDIDLQTYAEQLLQNKVGAVVAIEPKTGEVLAMVSAPTYDPNSITINRNRGRAYNQLQNDSLKPLFNRALQAQYPPGSTYKTVMGLIGLQLGLVEAHTPIYCPGYYQYNNLRVGCRPHPATNTMNKAIQFSCNNYFCRVFRKVIDIKDFYEPEVGLDTLRHFVGKFGMGRTLGIDIPGEKSGNVPTVADYDKIYPKHKGGWKFSGIISLAIGQGEFQMSTLQMANMATVLANRGYYFPPHLVKGFRGENNTAVLEKFKKRETVDIDPEHFDSVVQGMIDVTTAGTGRSAAIPGIPVAGKTGTVQNRGKDHSTFIAFAPAENPQIAIAVYVENAGGGGRYAAPIAGLLMEKYLTGDINKQKKYREKQILEANLIDPNP